MFFLFIGDRSQVFQARVLLQEQAEHISPATSNAHLSLSLSSRCDLDLASKRLYTPTSLRARVTVVMRHFGKFQTTVAFLRRCSHTKLSANQKTGRARTRRHGTRTIELDRKEVTGLIIDFCFKQQNSASEPVPHI